MKTRLTLIFSLFISLIFAQDVPLNPVPQKMELSGFGKAPETFKIDQQNTDKATQHLIASYFTSENTNNKGLKIKIGDVKDKFPKKFLKKVPSRAESYFIHGNDKKITVIGRDARGTYYGLRTLIDLLNAGKTPLGEITDYPDVTARGVVEGFYGTPWSFNHRMRQLDFYGANKLNTYIYGPKDDPYHSSPNWRKPYPEEEATQIKKLIDRAKLNEVDFVWAIHPGKDIKWNQEDRENLLHKFELMYDLGVRAFAVFFDDISGEGTDPNQQADLLNYLNENFVQAKDGVKPLILCPTEYNKGWSDLEGGYLKTLGKELDESIRIMWTGNHVIADIDQETMEWINEQIQREAFIWWNYPVSDYVRDHVLLGPAYGNEKSIANKVSGFVSNPMEHAEASKIAIYGVANYTWNMENYDPQESWQKALRKLMPNDHKALEIFARHNSDLGPNGHRYRREESVAFAPEAEQFLKQLKANGKVENLERIRDEFNAMLEASYVLLNSKDNQVLNKEIEPWVEQFQLTAQAGLSTLNMYSALKENKNEDFEQTYKAVKAMKSQMYKIDQTENQNPYQPGIKTASLVVTPLIDSTFVILTKTYNKRFERNLPLRANYNPHQGYTNVAQLKNQNVRLKNRKLALNPPLEVIKMEPQAYLGFELEKSSNIKQVLLKLEGLEDFSVLNLEISNNGTDWEEIELNKKDNELKVAVNKSGKFIRIINVSNEDVALKIKEFSAIIK
ncbi:hyaluronoglucosaminidase [Salegentibacter echinorum]|uniref:Hyaluronoglucosaminidase n=1 Tax=Salegentibacter echinorum TaxID=1073325 RepID=A0A1M5BS16_SALEC|nr:beta-N-acetylglucosaminidase [Salegentibacter echinorum]SHF45190.1 hyaluronoglucosaminidase [Salegentibacter echinorum]